MFLLGGPFDVGIGLGSFSIHWFAQWLAVADMFENKTDYSARHIQATKVQFESDTSVVATVNFTQSC